MGRKWEYYIFLSRFCVATHYRTAWRCGKKMGILYFLITILCGNTLENCMKMWEENGNTIFSYHDSVWQQIRGTNWQSSRKWVSAKSPRTSENHHALNPMTAVKIVCRKMEFRLTQSKMTHCIPILHGILGESQKAESSLRLAPICHHNTSPDHKDIAALFFCNTILSQIYNWF